MNPLVSNLLRKLNVIRIGSRLPEVRDIPKYSAGTEFVLEPEDFAPGRIRELCQLKKEVSIFSKTQRVILRVGSEFETEETLDSSYLTSPVAIHMHPIHGTDTPSFQDISTHEIHNYMNPGARSFLFTKSGIIEYGIPKTNPINGLPLEPGTDVRDIFYGWEKDLSMSSMTPEDYYQTQTALLRESGAIISEIPWQDEDSIEKLITEIRTILFSN